MSSQEKKNVADNLESTSSNRGSNIHDPPPPYTPYKTKLEPQPPLPPNIPPALKTHREEPAIPVTRPQIIRNNPGPQTTDDTDHSPWEIFKAMCCVVLCCPWIACVSCIGTCFHMCPDPKSKRNQ